MVWLLDANPATAGARGWGPLVDCRPEPRPGPFFPVGRWRGGSRPAANAAAERGVEPAVRCHHLGAVVFIASGSQEHARAGDNPIRPAGMLR